MIRRRTRGLQTHPSFPNTTDWPPEGEKSECKERCVCPDCALLSGLCPCPERECFNCSRDSRSTVNTKISIRNSSGGKPHCECKQAIQNSPSKTSNCVHLKSVFQYIKDCHGISLLRNSDPHSHDSVAWSLTVSFDTAICPDNRLHSQLGGHRPERGPYF